MPTKPPNANRYRQIVARWRDWEMSGGSLTDVTLASFTSEHCEVFRDIACAVSRKAFLTLGFVRGKRFGNPTIRENIL
jgi:hypothetical protein